MVISLNVGSGSNGPGGTGSDQPSGNSGQNSTFKNITAQGGGGGTSEVKTMLESGGYLGGELEIFKFR